MTGWQRCLNVSTAKFLIEFQKYIFIYLNNVFSCNVGENYVNGEAKHQRVNVKIKKGLYVSFQSVLSDKVLSLNHVKKLNCTE